MHRCRRAITSSAAVLALAAGGATRAEPIYGITDFLGAAQQLIAFDSATPATVTPIGFISGLASNQTLTGIDFRPSNGKLYAIGIAAVSVTDTMQLFTVDVATAALTPVGSGIAISSTADPRFSIDFDPVADVLRVVTSNGANYRVNPDTGALILQDTSISSSSVITGIVDVAYSNNVPGALTTTLYAYELFDDTIGRIGGPNGSPSPNGGVYTAIGSSGRAVLSGAVGFDISGATGTAYLSLYEASFLYSFYTVNLLSGATTFVGKPAGYQLLDISVGGAPRAVAEPGTLPLLTLGTCAIGWWARRRRTGLSAASAAPAIR